MMENVESNGYKIWRIRKETSQINTEEINGKQQYYEVGRKSLKLLLYKLRKEQANTTIQKIRSRDSGKIETSLEKNNRVKIL